MFRMNTSRLEPVLCSPEDRGQMVVEVFVSDSGQIGTIYKDQATVLFEVWMPGGEQVTFILDEFIIQLLSCRRELSEKCI
jgi:hypothetical protein